MYLTSDHILAMMAKSQDLQVGQVRCHHMLLCRAVIILPLTPYPFDRPFDQYVVVLI
ncbi:hypothetical protein BCIN_08g01630 [Botrytis cinerea B05.10]|uniref:Uncharacterized protein n=1 Tax=Botryotinia fuckeliana (strain B05.10) TaxID=332648 RepID=A0A384JQ01_BOTFB|nr:hypothetical protein BCIN_08g01630 [Botrytis cinerea B05.10]ATZ52434.1 hypothetical protein BCIN_08g01630 [Botrytis cinerea B05.10]